jgi:hypothetical protein
MAIDKREQIVKELERKTAEVDSHDIKIRQLNIAIGFATEAGTPDGTEYAAYLQGLLDGENKMRLRADIMKRASVEVLKEYSAEVAEDEQPLEEVKV